MPLEFQIHISRLNKTIVSIDRFEIPENKITFLFGESGIGKTILSKAVFGLLDPALLEVQINGLDYPAYLALESTRKIQQNGFFVFQEPSTHLNPLLRLNEQLREGSLENAPGEPEILRRLWNTEGDEPIQHLLEVYPKPYRPSGGEKQRILLAMAFKKIALGQQNRRSSGSAGNGTGLFIFDEPTGSLDNNFRNHFLKLLFEQFQQFLFTALLITHDYSIISEVYEKYAGLREQIAYKELSLQGGRLALRDFAPRAYLEWLRAEKPVAAPQKPAAKPLLQVRGGYEVFGKKMIISSHGFPSDGSRKDYGMFHVQPGEIIYLKAASGVGKTTLAKIIMGLQECKNLEMVIGRWKFSERTPKTAWRKLVWGKLAGMAFQHADEALNLKAKVKEVFGGLPARVELNDAYIRLRLQELFDMEIDGAFLNKKVAHLSGGQKQRLNLLRTLVLDTDLLILDEPLNGLDFLSIQKVIAALQEKQREGKAILMISHNEEIFDAIIPPENVYYLFGA